jgi:uncharacterized membrane protein YkgB
MGLLTRLDHLGSDIDYLTRASMVRIFFFFSYQKWFEYEAQVLIPYISNGPLVFWLYPDFSVRGASRCGMDFRCTVAPRISAKEISARLKEYSSVFW